MSRRRAGKEEASGPLSGPGTVEWRRTRLLRIGSSQDVEGEREDSERTPLVGDREGSPERPSLRAHHSSYGALPTGGPPRTRSRPILNFRDRHGLPPLPKIALPARVSISNPTTPFADRHSFPFHTQRPISAYDAPNARKISDELSPSEIVAKANGIRVWYSSFSSIDWLHDAIKDSARLYRLRRRKSVRGRLRNWVDRLAGWVIVTIVGILTAVVAFLIVRGEQWLFDIKEGYCASNWLHAKRFCCPSSAPDDDMVLGIALTTPVFVTMNGAADEACGAWKTWAQVLSKGNTSESNTTFIEYLAYGFFALLLAFISCLLTIYLTPSTSFSTRKDSGVLAPHYIDESSKATNAPTIPDGPATRKVMYYAAGSGIPEIKTILSGFVIHGYLGGRTLFTKSVGLALSVASGLTLGKEGPFVHIASCIGNIVSRYFTKYENNEGKRREILSAASAAGVAVAFGAPIGGVLFSLEEVSYFFPPKVMWRTFFCAMIAAGSLRFLDPFGTGKIVLFQVTYDKDWHAYELVPFLFLGVFGGVYGAYFSKLNYRWSRDVRNKTWLRTHPISEVLLITLLTTILGFINTYTHMGGTELVYNLFAECRTGSPNTHSGLCVLDPPTQAVPVIKAVFVAMVVKGVLTIITFGIKVPAGIFIPSLGVGACAGRILGILIQWAQWHFPDARMFRSCQGDLDCVVPGLYSMVGAAASLSGVTRTTISLAVIMFELTDSLSYVIPVMLSVLVAKTVADALEPKGIYDLVIDLAQLPYLDAKHEYLWGTLEISDVVERDVEAIHIDRPVTVENLRDQLQTVVSSGYADSGLPILRPDDDGARMIGYIGASELEHALSIVADDAEHPVYFTDKKGMRYADLSSSSISSIPETGDADGYDPFDFSIYMDQAPLTVQINSPLELVHQFFVKLGARYVIVLDADGCYEGVIDKKAWLAFLGELEDKAH